MSEKKDFEITREFNAPLDLVWKVYTEAEHLAKWWGPAGLKMLKTTLDFRPGGIFHYGMETPDGHAMWGKFVYKEIVPKTKIVFVVSFSDVKGGYTRHPMAPNWPLETINTVMFSEKNGKTLLIMKGHPINSTPEEDAMFYGAFDSMNQGFKGTLDQLEDYLKTFK
ncbi:MAG: SRPBCC family protein [Bacteroidia bacterium]